MGSVYCTYYALPHLEQTITRGRIVDQQPYSEGTPSLLKQLHGKQVCDGRRHFDVVRMELEDSGVSVTTVYPDFVATHFAANVRDAADALGARMQQTYSEKQ